MAPMAKITQNQLAYQALLQKHSKRRIADMAEVSAQAVTRWSEVPLSRVLRISKATGMKPEEILPDPYSQVNPTESPN